MHRRKDGFCEYYRELNLQKHRVQVGRIHSTQRSLCFHLHVTVPSCYFKKKKVIRQVQHIFIRVYTLFSNDTALLEQAELLVQKLERRLKERGWDKNLRTLFNEFINFLKNTVTISIIDANHIILVHLHTIVCTIHITLRNHGLVIVPQNMMVIY